MTIYSDTYEQIADMLHDIGLGEYRLAEFDFIGDVLYVDTSRRDFDGMIRSNKHHVVLSPDPTGRARIDGKRYAVRVMYNPL